MKVLLTGLFAALAVVAGLVIAAFAAVSGALLLGLSRLLGRSSGVRVRTQFGGRPRPAASAPKNSGDVIDVTATEVTADSSLR